MKNKNKLVDKNKILEALKKRAEGFFYSEEILEYGEEVKPKKPKDDDELCEAMCDDAQNKKLKKSQKSVSQNDESKNPDVYLAQNKSSEETLGVKNENQQTLVLVKKKVTTHYIPPDMSAIKVLLEDFWKEIDNPNDVLERLSDEELLKLRSEILETLKE